MMLYAPYAEMSFPFLGNLPAYCVMLLPLADDCVGIEEGVARDHSAHRSGCGSFFS
jgi:hypothetical protein